MWPRLDNLWSSSSITLISQPASSRLLCKHGWSVNALIPDLKLEKDFNQPGVVWGRRGLINPWFHWYLVLLFSLHPWWMTDCGGNHDWHFMYIHIPISVCFVKWVTSRRLYFLWKKITNKPYTHAVTEWCMLNILDVNCHYGVWNRTLRLWVLWCSACMMCGSKLWLNKSVVSPHAFDCKLTHHLSYLLHMYDASSDG